MMLPEYDLPGIHSHGAGKEKRAARFLCGDVHLDGARIGQELIKVQGGDDKIT
jgi:hypothetical protein